MRVLGVDPGFDRIGVSVMEYRDAREYTLYSTCIETERHTPLANRLLEIGTALESIITTYTPDVVAIETLFFNKNVKTAIDVAQARGVILYISQQYGCTLYEFSPQSIKIAITGYGKSDKTAVTHFLKQTVVNIPNDALDDEYDAIAVGVTCLAHYGRCV
jgi:crossover junction endodeoxyribonuclease RuvC